MNSDPSSRAALLEQLRQKRQKGEKNKYQGDSNDVPIEDHDDSENEDEKEDEPKRKRQRASTIPVKKLSDFSGFTVNAADQVESTLNGHLSPNGQLSTNGQPSINGHQHPNPNLKPLTLYCMDAYEDVFKKPGDVFLFGKTKSETSNDFVSCCVRIQGVQRRIYVLPRKLKLNPVTNQETDVSVNAADVIDELSKKLKQMNIKGFKINDQLVKKRYCLNAADVPTEAEYLELRYPFNQPQLPQDFSGSTFGHIFGTTSTGLEIFLLQCRLRLPCWITLKKTVTSTVPFSWCNVEANVENLDPADVEPLNESRLSPPSVGLMSLAIKTMPNLATGHKEIVAVGVWFNPAYCMEKEKQDESLWRHLCVVKKGAEQAHLFDFKPKLAKENFTKVQIQENERALLSYLVAEIQKCNPDIIVGHDLLDFELQILVSRMTEKKMAPQLQKLGRLRRSAPPHRIFTKFDVCDTMAGRLICDLKIMAMEFILRSKSFDLTELVAQMLNEKRVAVPEEAVAEAYNTSSSLIDFLKTVVADAGLCWRLMAKLGCLSLTSEITRVVGGVWSKTLAGGRSERTEFLLLHAFEAAAYIPPEKMKAKRGFHKEVAIDEDEDQIDIISKKKNSYAGGLVLDPKKGLYDSYVLLLDFNSLYPSIIMEYNVCFTTIDQRKYTDESVIPDVPQSDLEPGILPKVVRNLVERRREVKKLMKNADTPERYQEYNIRQQALKITANSMYGCLGFSSSRFYAKPLAALITSRGREILMDTKHLVERMHLEVVYGDTDSIMINTNSDNLDEVMELGKKVKAEVNKKYRQLELDIDGVYKKLLLYKKKKYAGLMVDLDSIAAGQGNVKVKREMKGLDIVRRDCPPVAVEAGSRILDELLSDADTNEVLGRIFRYLAELAESMRNGNVPVEKFEILKQLNKHPAEYGDKKQPHVSVALRLNANGRHFKQGDVVAYIICDNGTSDAAMQRAYHRSELGATDALKTDISYYLSQQVHPIVSRLMESVKDADAGKIAECLGLDASAYRKHSLASSASRDLDRQHDDFTGCVPFTFTCQECKTDNEISSVFVTKDNDTVPSLHQCIKADGKAVPWRGRAMLINRLNTIFHQLVKKHYQNWLVCDDITCSHRTRQLVLNVGSGGKAQCPSCNQFSLHQEYSSQSLYSQLAYFQYIFDWNNATSKLPGAYKGISTDPDVRKVYDELKKTSDTFVAKNAYAYVDLGKLFRSFM